MEPTHELKMLLSQLVTADMLILKAKTMLEESNRRQPSSIHLPRPLGTTDHAIYQFLTESNGGATKREELFDVFGLNEEAKRIVEEKLSMMERFGLVTVEGDLVTVRKARP